MAASTWAHWQLQLLHAAGLPATGNDPSAYTYGTINWLSNWHTHESATCDRNPLNISRSAPGSSRCKRLWNGKWARNYPSRGAAAQAFAEQLNLTDYPNLRRALASGDPRGYADQPGLAGDVAKWGSKNWANALNAANMPPSSPPQGGDVKAEANVAGAWSRLHRVLSREGSRTIAELQRSAAGMRRIERRLRRV